MTKLEEQVEAIHQVLVGDIDHIGLVEVVRRNQERIEAAEEMTAGLVQDIRGNGQEGIKAGLGRVLRQQRFQNWLIGVGIVALIGAYVRRLME